MLKRFEPDLVGWLVEKFREIGVDVRTNTIVDGWSAQATAIASARRPMDRRPASRPIWWSTTRQWSVAQHLRRGVALLAEAGAEFIPATFGPLPPRASSRQPAAHPPGYVCSPCARGAASVIRNNPTRNRTHAFDRGAYRLRNITKRTFCRPKDWRRAAATGSPATPSPSSPSPCRGRRRADLSKALSLDLRLRVLAAVEGRQAAWNSVDCSG